MASYTITLGALSPSGEKLRLDVSGDIVVSKWFELDQLRTMDVDVEAFLLQYLKLAARGRTKAQIRTALQTGVTVTT